MNYTLEHIARTLREARQAQGLSQRALSDKAGIPQSHISKIESGAVDLRTSSLVELARVLNLELEFVPRKAVSAVRTITQLSKQMALDWSETNRRALEELKRLESIVARATQTHPTLIELAQIQRQVRELRQFPVSKKSIGEILSAAAGVKSFHENGTDLAALRESLTILRNLNQLNSEIRDTIDEAERVKPLYSLDDHEHG